MIESKWKERIDEGEARCWMTIDGWAAFLSLPENDVLFALPTKLLHTHL